MFLLSPTKCEPNEKKNSKSVLINSLWFFIIYKIIWGEGQEEASKNNKISNKCQLKSRIKWSF